MLASKLQYALKLFVTVLPWLLSMYTLYWLEYSGIWITQTPYRDKFAVLILLTGMGLSFLLYSLTLGRSDK